jgi:S-DNA-T family DNA segregation ATPase FtsK/SpoIIIE
VLERAGRPGPQTLFLIDDLDARFREWPDEHRHAALAALDVIVRDGRRNGVTVVATAGQAHRLAPGIRESFARQLLLRHPTRADLVHAGGSGDLWRDHDPSGSGQWRGHRVQLVEAPPLPGERHEALPPLDLAGPRVVAVVSASPRADASALRAAGLDPLLLEPLGDTVVRTALARHAGHADAPGDADAAARCVVVGDADAWVANWSIAALVREQATIVVHGGPREYRTLAPGPSLPPLLDDAATQCWLLEPAADARRAGWPPGSATQTGLYN